ncbi:GAF domain-containing protein [Modestobacter sp. L9-4]|uniref:GAF domain-containing protein n=1 Tax=Modestobacter sp. L9-4 TaxID=2851567 RepID=UPI001C751C8A|nr:GAF domain-containing protein [Modestobacter sp. L9-4]QXG75950.1 GAF domain-containing protein [Modestobacter sp. L9-4]
MDIAARFTTALVEARSSPDRTDPLPDQLSRAAAAALRVDGVGLSLAAEQPTLLGASGAMPRTAEQLQFTVGTGPCLVAVDTQFPLFAVESYLHRRWPVYHDLLRTQTPYRSVVAHPMTHGLTGVGALVVYLEDPAGPLQLDSFDASAVVGLVSAALTTSTSWAAPHQPGLQHWLDTPGARVRALTWQAVDLVRQVLDTSDVDALAVLRSRAYGSGRLVDEIAGELLRGELSVHDLG